MIQSLDELGVAGVMGNQPKKYSWKAPGELYGRLRRSVGEDIRWLNSLRPAFKITGLIFGIALIVGAWYPGAEWWTTPTTYVTKGMARGVPPLVEVGVIVAIILVVYIAHSIDRDHESR